MALKWLINLIFAPHEQLAVGVYGRVGVDAAKNSFDFHLGTELMFAKQRFWNLKQHLF